MNPNNFPLNTDYPLDKIVFRREGSIVATKSGTVQSFNTDLDILIGWQAVFSYTPDFTNTFYYGDLTDWRTGTETGVAMYTQGGDFLSTKNTNIISAYLGQDDPRSSVTVYYKMIGYPLEPLSTSKLQSSQGLNNNFILNTDVNYMKLVEAGTAFFPLDGSPRPPVIVNHNLGYKPTVLTWIGFLNYTDDFTPTPISESLMPYISYVGAPLYGQAVARVTDTQVTFYDPGIQQTYSHYFYRIYADEAV